MDDSDVECTSRQGLLDKFHMSVYQHRLSFESTRAGFLVLHNAISKGLASTSLTLRTALFHIFFHFEMLLLYELLRAKGLG